MGFTLILATLDGLDMGLLGGVIGCRMICDDDVEDVFIVEESPLLSHNYWNTSTNAIVSEMLVSSSGLVIPFPTLTYFSASDCGLWQERFASSE
ncbi:hypothetical protein Tco_0241505 [Tanacetum coccineum]